MHNHVTLGLMFPLVRGDGALEMGSEDLQGCVQGPKFRSVHRRETTAGGQAPRRELNCQSKLREPSALPLGGAFVCLAIRPDYGAHAAIY